MSAPLANLRSARRTARLPLRDLADLIGVTPSHMAKIEAGKVAPTLRAAYLLASRFGVPVGWILEGAAADPLDTPAPAAVAVLRMHGVNV